MGDKRRRGDDDGDAVASSSSSSVEVVPLELWEGLVSAYDRATELQS